MATLEKDELRSSPAYQMWLLTNTWQRIVRRTLEPLGLTHVQYTILASVAYLLERGKPVTQAQVCRFGSMDRNMVSQVVRSLVDRDLVERAPHPKDGRANHLGLTPEGRRLWEEARALVAPQNEAFYAPLGGRLESLVRILDDLNEAHRDDED